MRQTSDRVAGLKRRFMDLQDIEHREWVLARFARVTEPILLLLAFGMIPLTLGPFLWDLSNRENATFAALNAVIWVVFAVDYAVKLALSVDRKRFLRTHWVEAGIVLLPFFRPLYLFRLVLFGSRAIVGVRRLAEADFVFVLTAGLVIICSTVMFSVDSGNPQFDSYGDALWWGVVTVTTVGYGDIVPATTPGRFVAFFLMLGGITLFGAVAGNVVALLAKGVRPSSAAAPASADASSTSGDIVTELRALGARLEALERRLSQ